MTYNNIGKTAFVVATSGLYAGCAIACLGCGPTNSKRT